MFSACAGVRYIAAGDCGDRATDSRGAAYAACRAVASNGRL